jgi:Tectonin domain
MPGVLKQVAVGGDAVLGIDPDDSAYSWNGFAWGQLQGEKIKQLSVNVHEIWGVNPSEDRFRWNGSLWESLRSVDTISLAGRDEKRGKAKAASSMLYIVCNYYPPGNQAGPKPH